MPFAYTISAVIPASPKEVYDAWLDGKGHAAMTGHPAKSSGAVGDAFEAWDGYISGRNEMLSPGKRIVQVWRTTEFTDGDEDSLIDVTLAKAPRGTKLTLTHTNVPDGHTGYKSGWVDHYFNPMKAYFTAQIKAKLPAKKKPKAKAGTKTAKAKVAKKPVKAGAKTIAKKTVKKLATRKPAKKKAASKKRK